MAVISEWLRIFEASICCRKAWDDFLRLHHLLCDLAHFLSLKNPSQTHNFSLHVHQDWCNNAAPYWPGQIDLAQFGDLACGRKNYRPEFCAFCLPLDRV